MTIAPNMHWFKAIATDECSSPSKCPISCTTTDSRSIAASDVDDSVEEEVGRGNGNNSLRWQRINQCGISIDQYQLGWRLKHIPHFERKISVNTFCLFIFNFLRKQTKIILVCNFVNLKMVNWRIHLVNNLSTLISLQISPTWGN